MKMQKHNDIQSDNENNNNSFRQIIYSVDENGKYFSTISPGFEPENIAHSLAIEEISNRIENVKREILAGNVSPLAYYLERELMTPLRLSGEVGISTWRIKRHLKPKVFSKISDKYLNRYAKFFKVSVSDFVNLNSF
jgi:hypothetical protein